MSSKNVPILSVLGIFLVGILLVPGVLQDAEAMTEAECLSLAGNLDDNMGGKNTVVTCDTSFDVTVFMGQRLHIQNPNGGSANILPAVNFGSPGTYQYTVSDGWASGTITLVNPPNIGISISNTSVVMDGSSHIVTFDYTNNSLDLEGG